jgi:hypothetical protein
MCSYGRVGWSYSVVSGSRLNLSFRIYLQARRRVYGNAGRGSWDVQFMTRPSACAPGEPVRSVSHSNIKTFIPSQLLLRRD